MSERGDIFDQASELEQRINQGHVDAALAKASESLKPEQQQNPDGSWPEPNCVDCEDPMKPGRLAMGRIRCVNCQSLLERAPRR